MMYDPVGRSEEEGFFGDAPTHDFPLDGKGKGGEVLLLNEGKV